MSSDQVDKCNLLISSILSTKNICHNCQKEIHSYIYGILSPLHNTEYLSTSGLFASIGSEYFEKNLQKYGNGLISRIYLDPSSQDLPVCCKSEDDLCYIHIMKNLREKAAELFGIDKELFFKKN